MIRHERYIEQLFEIAKSNEPSARVRIAAGVVHKNQLISIGTNQTKTHTFQAKFGKNEDAIYMHAEVDAIHSALKLLTLDELAQSTLYIARAKYKGKEFVRGLSKPCSGCARAIIKFGIQKVYHTIDGEGYVSL